MNFTAGQIADQLDGTVIGNRDVDINALSKIEEARKGSLTFLANPKYTEYIYSLLMHQQQLSQTILNLLRRLPQHL